MLTKGYITSSGVPLGIFWSFELVNVECCTYKIFFGKETKQPNWKHYVNCILLGLVYPCWTLTSNTYPSVLVVRKNHKILNKLKCPNVQPMYKCQESDTNTWGRESKKHSANSPLSSYLLKGGSNCEVSLRIIRSKFSYVLENSFMFLVVRIKQMSPINLWKHKVMN